MSCDVIGHVTVLDQSDPSTKLPPWRPLVVKLLSTNQMLTQILPLSDNRGLYGGAPSGNKRTTNQNAPFQMSTNQKLTQNFLGFQKDTYYLRGFVRLDSDISQADFYILTIVIRAYSFYGCLSYAVWSSYLLQQCLEIMCT